MARCIGINLNLEDKRTFLDLEDPRATPMLFVQFKIDEIYYMSVFHPEREICFQFLVPENIFKIVDKDSMVYKNTLVTIEHFKDELI